MDNIGDWLYIVLIAGAAISSLISSGKKKKQQQEAQDQSHQQPEINYPTRQETTTDKDLWDPFWDEPEPEHKTIFLPPPSKMKKQMVKSKKTVPAAAPSPFLAGETEIERKIRQQAPVFLEESEKSIISVEDFRDPEELRKAVIYTEILNRKY